MTIDSEISIPGYSLFRRDRPVDREGGGVLLYVKSALQPAEFVPDSNFSEQVWCKILDSAGEDFYLGVFYRTPTDGIFGSGNHDTLRGLINTFGELRKHFVLMVLNPLAAEKKRQDWASVDICRINSGAATPGEIPGEIRQMFV